MILFIHSFTYFEEGCCIREHGEFHQKSLRQLHFGKKYGVQFTVSLRVLAVAEGSTANSNAQLAYVELIVCVCCEVSPFA